MTIYRGPGGAGDATNDAIVNQVASYATSAASSATNAANSASEANTSANNASTSATNAASSASQAATSASNAASSASSASSSASTATTQATNAANSATAAAASSGSASSSASNASSSAATAASKAAEAETYAIRAETAEENAVEAYADTLAIFGDATDVAAAVSAASTSATNAANSATAAATSATNAASSAASASNAASAAANSATTANAEASEAQEAANTAVAALQDAQEIYDGIDAIDLAVSSAQGSASSAATSASTATTQASNAATSATNAANSATQAANSAASAAAIVLGVSSNRASIRPSLLLDFANTRQLDPRVTFARASTGRFYDGTTVVKAEENLVTYSQEFDNGAWTKSATTITANATTAPDGTSTADSVVGNGASIAHYMNQVSSASAVGKTFSIYAKADTNNYIQLAFAADLAPWANFDLSTGTVGSTGTNQTATITAVGNGWYRCAISTSSTSATDLRFFLVTSSTATRSETNTLSTGVYLWGAQLEQRSTVTAYTPTTTVPITNYIPALQTAALNEARFDVDPVTGESKGLLIEEQRTNLLTYSEQFDNAVWTKISTGITANTIVSPDGLLNGDLLVSANVADRHYITQSYTGSTTATYTLSAYAKQATGSYEFGLVFGATAINSSNRGSARWNLQTGALILSGGSGNTSVTSSSITPVGNGWYKCSVTFIPDTSGAAASFTYGISSAPNGQSFVTVWTANGVSGHYIWGAQLEAGSFPTSYIPTVASQVTRSADSASMTGSNFSSWYRADEGTIYADYTGSQGVSGSRRVLSINDGSVNNSINFIGSNSSGSISNYFEILNGNVIQASLGAGSYSATQQLSAGSYKTNDIAFSKNGASSLTDIAASIPSVTQIEIGRGAGVVLNGTIKRIAYYPKRLSNTELQGITS